MKRAFTKYQCLSLQEIKAYLNEEVSDEEQVHFDAHFADCTLCSEVKESYATINQLGVEEDVVELKDAVFNTINHRQIKGRRLFLTRIAAGFLLLITGAATILYWNLTANDRLFSQHFEPFEIEKPPVWRSEDIGDIPTTYEDLSLPKELQSAIDFYEAGKFKESLSYFEQFRKVQPRHTYANLLYGTALLKEKKLDSAITCLEEVQQTNSKFSKDATWYLALAYIANKEETKARKLLKSLKNIDSAYYSEKATVLLKEIGS